MKKTKTKKQSDFTEQEREVGRKLNQIMTKLFYLSVTVAQLGAVGTLALVQGETAGMVAKIIAVPLAMDFFIRVSVITKPFFKSE